MFADRCPLGSFVFSVQLFTRLSAGCRPLLQRLDECVMGCDGFPSVRISGPAGSFCQGVFGTGGLSFSIRGRETAYSVSWTGASAAAMLHRSRMMKHFGGCKHQHFHIKSDGI